MTELQICNSALQKVGAELITSLLDTTKRAILVNEQYPKIRDMLLYEYNWNFSIFRAALTVDPTAPEFGFGYRFPIPADCLRVLDLEYPEVEFKVEGGYILTDSSEMKIRYIKQITDTTKYTPMFTELLALFLAGDIAYPLVQSASLTNMIKAEANELLRKARSLNSHEGTPTELYKSYFTDGNHN